MFSLFFHKDRVFHGLQLIFFFLALDFVFHGLDFAEIFHGNKLFFTGCFKDFFTGRIKFSRVEN